MGVFGAIIGSEIGRVGGRVIGETLGRKIAGKNGAEAGRNIGEKAGQLGGGMLGTLAPFAHGGQVPASKGMGYPALLHGQEYVLPYGIKPTKKQIQAVKKKGGRYHYKD